MKSFIALVIASLTVAAQGSYLPTINTAAVAWPYSSARNSWNGWNTWDNQHHHDDGLVAYPYVNDWSSAPVASAYGPSGLYGHKTVVQENLGGHAYPWGLPWGTYGAGGYGGHHGWGKSVVPVSKMIAATPGSLHVAPVPVGGKEDAY
ncbi:uncharacterized protein LOC135705794 [Ochlerotatus camptorhynchus]|uniref:uncharacterized protein LOC135705794 n=1 Tax=Ochlerotatus camptorhynchus TaxID=644619 RepID=UPI0031D8A76B